MTIPWFIEVILHSCTSNSTTESKNSNHCLSTWLGTCSLENNIPVEMTVESRLNVRRMVGIDFTGSVSEHCGDRHVEHHNHAPVFWLQVSVIGPHVKWSTCVLFIGIKVYWGCWSEWRDFVLFLPCFFWQEIMKIIHNEDKTSWVLKAYFHALYDTKWLSTF